MSTKFLKSPFVRVGINYFKIIEKKDRFGTKHTELKQWNKQEIVEDLGRAALKDVVKYDDFTIEPNNIKYKSAVDGCYNMYRKFPHRPKAGSWKWTKILMQHIFGEQYEQGMTYLQVCYTLPKQALPVLVLVSEKRQTGKSTFIDWMNAIFGNNMGIINPDDIGRDFNANYATNNIIAIEETLIDKSASVEKIKSLSTQKFITVNMKHVSHFKIPFFGKIIMASNNEHKFLKVDEEEIRFFIRKIDIPEFQNHNILNDMIKEIPAFLHHLKNLPKPDLSKSRMVLTQDEIHNESLNVVKAYSKNWLYKELVEYIDDLFSEDDFLLDKMTFSARDIKEKWFKNDQKVTLSYLKEVFLSDFKLVFSDKKQRYLSINDVGKHSKAFILTKEHFEKVTGRNIEHAENEGFDGTPF